MAIHKACRSCHVPNAPPESEEFVPDCSSCHTAVDPVPTLAQLLPGGKVNVTVVLPSTADGGDVEGEDAGAWTRALVPALVDEGLHVPGHGAPAPELVVTVTRIEGPGRTDAGTTFVAVRYDAVLRIGRAEVVVRGAPFVDATTAPRQRARDELIARIVPIVAY